MGTSCNVSVQFREDLYKTIYVGYDGYPSYMFNTLTDNYNSQELAEALVNMGDASSVGPTLQLSEFYHRDRNEDFTTVAPVLSEDLNEAGNESYHYLWADNRWKII